MYELIIGEAVLLVSLLGCLAWWNGRNNERMDMITAAISMVPLALERMSDNLDLIELAVQTAPSVDLLDMRRSLKDLESAIIFNGPSPDEVTNLEIGKSIIGLSTNQKTIHSSIHQLSSHTAQLADQLEFLQMAMNRNNYYVAPSVGDSN